MNAGVMSAGAIQPERGDGFRWWLMAVIITFSDSLLSYFSRTFTGAGLRVNAAVPVMILIAMLAGGMRRLAIPPGYVVCLVLGYLGFLLGFTTFGEVNFNRFLTVTSGFAAFLVGFAVASCLNSQRVTQWMNYLFYLGVVYSIVCALAVFHVAPALFPVIETIHMKDGAMVVRPEVTTDQNFQVFYLLPCVLPLIRELRSWRALMAFAASALSIAVLAQLQTRSGAIVFGMSVALAAYAGYRRSNNKLQIIGIAAAGFFATVVVLAPTISRVAAPLIDRFTTDDFETFYGRLWSASYMFDHLLNPSWWIPRGNEGFRQMAGGEVPHFNGTAFFLEAGLLGFICWVGVHIVPVVILSVRFLRARVDMAQETVFVLGAATVLMSLSLNVPYVETVWLWCGAVAAMASRDPRAQVAAQSSTSFGIGQPRVAPPFRNLMS